MRAQRLPKDVRERVLEKVNFIVARGVNGTGFSLNVLNDVVEVLVSTGELRPDEKDPSVKLSTIKRANLKIPFILLNFANMRGMPKEEMISVIAHEIAHFILGHFDDYHKPWEDREKETDNLIKIWGFRRAWRSDMKCSLHLKAA
jgi:DNA-binding ferritin-like protein (Dps family)